MHKVCVRIDCHCRKASPQMQIIYSMRGEGSPDLASHSKAVHAHACRQRVTGRLHQYHQKPCKHFNDTERHNRLLPGTGAE